MKHNFACIQWRCFVTFIIAFCLGLAIGRIGKDLRNVSVDGATTTSSVRPTLTTPRNNILSVNNENSDIVAQARSAESIWKSGKGYLWLQHARKAGGTSLCMILRDNAKGLVKVTPSDFANQIQWQTCQLVKFCSDCNLKKRFKDKASSLSPVLRTVMKKSGRNIIEVEGNGVPVDLLEGDQWSDFVFITSIRNPIERIKSSLRHDAKFESCREETMTPEQTASCLSRYLGKETILETCQEWIYVCFSNYFVRMFSGMELEYTNDKDMIHRAKRNFHRFSCVIMQEEWSRTEHCLGDRLGLYRRSSGAFNVDGLRSHPSRVDENHIESNSLKLLSDHDYETLVSLNQADLEFYEWAKEQILLSSIENEM